MPAARCMRMGGRSRSLPARRRPQRPTPCALPVQRLNADVFVAGKTPYVLNLDPAVRTLPYEPNIDIRDTVQFKDVMKQYATLSGRRMSN